MFQVIPARVDAAPARPNIVGCERFHPVVTASADPNDEVAGKVFCISAEELEAADRYEVSDYKRIEVTLKSGIQAWVYVKA